MEKVMEPVKKMTSNRTYYGKVAIVGPSGSGKSYLSKTADISHTGYINTENKPLPYRREATWKFEGKPKTWASFMANLKAYADNPDIKLIIIDSQTNAFNILNNEMGKNFSGWDIPKAYNKQVYEYLTFLKNIEKDVIIISHDESVKTDSGVKSKRMTVHFKEYEGKIEEHYTIVLYTGTRLREGKPEYFLRTFEEDTSTKVPEGLFPGKDGNNLLEIPNDASYIFSCLQKYYS